ncbi:MAG TPA: hypothetical protein VF008_14995 [Niastella sp.]
MLTLAALDTWKLLENPFGNSEDIPALIEKLDNSFSAEILNEICWDYIYHQNSLYEATFATIPYLVSICEKADDPYNKMSTFINIGIILSEMDANDELLLQIFSDSIVDRETVNAIISSYKSALKQLPAIGQSLFNMVPELDEDDKRHFLVALATVHERYDVAKVFCTYSGNDEYMCTCPHCDTEFYIWNKENELVLYTQDPVFKKNQPDFPITPRPLSIAQSFENISIGPNYEWLVFYINHLGIYSLQPVIGYLFGETQCPECKTSFDIFDAVSRPLV